MKWYKIKICYDLCIKNGSGIKFEFPNNSIKMCKMCNKNFFVNPPDENSVVILQ